MGFFEGYRTKYVYNTIDLHAESVEIWAEITNVMISNYKFPFLFSILGIPKPMTAQVVKPGVGGYRIAHFSNDAKFHQEILEWELNKNYRFKFNPNSTFKVGHFMKLANGPFEIQTGGYELTELQNGIKLTLSSNYNTHGLVGSLMHIPFRLCVYFFQRYLLKGIESNLKQKH